MKTVEEVRNFCKRHYFTNIEEKGIWQPFEDYSLEQVEEFVEDMTCDLCNHLGIKYKII